MDFLLEFPVGCVAEAMEKIMQQGSAAEPWPLLSGSQASYLSYLMHSC